MGIVLGIVAESVVPSTMYTVLLVAAVLVVFRTAAPSLMLFLLLSLLLLLSLVLFLLLSFLYSCCYPSYIPTAVLPTAVLPTVVLPTAIRTAVFPTAVSLYHADYGCQDCLFQVLSQLETLVDSYVYSVDRANDHKVARVKKDLTEDGFGRFKSLF